MIEIISWSTTRVNGKPNEPQHRKVNKVEKLSGRVNINGDRSCGHKSRCNVCDESNYTEIVKDRSLEFKPGDTVKYFMGDVITSVGIKRNYVGLYNFIGFARWDPSDGELVAVCSALFTDKTINITAGDVFCIPKIKFSLEVDSNEYPTCPQRYIFEKVDVRYIH